MGELLRGSARFQNRKGPLLSHPLPHAVDQQLEVTMREFCEECGGDAQKEELIPIHLTIKGVKRTWYFHNRKPPMNCLEQWLRNQRARFDAGIPIGEDAL